MEESTINQNNSTLFLNGNLNYDSALKKLLLILKVKSSDKISQLEDLWDSINFLPTINTNSLENGSSIASSSSSSLSSSRSSPTSSDRSSPDSISIEQNSSSSNDSINVNLKRNISTSNLSNGSSNKKLKVVPNQTEVLQTTKTTSTTSKINENKKMNNSKPTANPSKSTNQNTKIPKISVVDMLDISCTICKQFNQELNNKLIECRKCTRLYHQMCHMPQIENHETEQFDTSKNTQSNKMVWYFNECSSCKQENNSSIAKTQSNDSLITLLDESSRTSTASERDDDAKVKSNTTSSLPKIATSSSSTKLSNVEKRELKDDKSSSFNLPSAKFFKRDTIKVNFFTLKHTCYLLIKHFHL
jgi:hypothetical protein